MEMPWGAADLLQQTTRVPRAALTSSMLIWRKWPARLPMRRLRSRHECSTFARARSARICSRLRR